MTPEYCPNCGAEVPAKAKACPECGADEKTGWSDQAYTERLGLPDEEFNYNEFVEREFGGGKPRISRRKHLWKFVAATLAALIIYGLIRTWM